MLFIVLGAGLSQAQPFIYTRGAVNAASFLPFGIAAGAIAQGSIFTIFGRNLGPAAGVQAFSYPLSETLSGVSVTVSQGSTTIKALPVYVSAAQINAIMPSNAPLGTVSVRVLVNNVKSNALPLRVGANSLGIFTVNGNGVGPGILQNFVSQNNQPVNSTLVPASPGQFETLWATGLGPVNADNIQPTAGNLPVDVEVFVGGQPAPTSYAGRAPCCAGTDQIVFQLPRNTPTGCWVPVYVRLAKTIVSNVVTMAVTTDGSPCTSQVGTTGAALLRGGKIGLLAPLRSDIRQGSPPSPVDLRTDYLVARFGQEKGGPFAFNPLYSLPPAGTCTSYSGGGDWMTAANVAGLAPGVKVLNAGPFTVSGASKSVSFQVPLSPLTLGYLGYVNPALPGSVDTTILAPGPFTIQSQDGSDVTALKLPFNMISPLTWTNRDQIATVDRSTPLTVNWSGGEGQTVAVVGGSADLPTNVSGVFVCIVAAGANSITVPPVILANLPPSRGNSAYSKGIVFLVGAGKVTGFNAGGLDGGALGPLYLSGKAVDVQ